MDSNDAFHSILLDSEVEASTGGASCINWIFI